MVALAIILGLLIIRAVFRPPGNHPNLYLTVISPAAARVATNQILQMLSGMGATASLKRFDHGPESLEAAFLVEFKQVDHLEQFTRRLRDLSPEVRVSCVDDRGIGI